MINFSKEELNYIKKTMENVLDIWNTGTKEKLKQYIEDIGGELLDTVLLINRNDWFLVDQINKNDCINGKIKDFALYGLGMWCFIDAYMDTEELRKLLGNGEKEEYFTIYDKVLNEDDEGE